ncbi:MAG: hypothetical protein LUQ50_04805 [Methanospirillum sp.]|uniref:hypothetical protein n=1 Tax=Methanospirillum sp. TaxID=45200 RepID=UPI00236EFCD6|nr:hypothetical protein [Methanospirillum sp.]MDD1728376.1 hypothetical protein [Methanospirillum sp.]
MKIIKLRFSSKCKDGAIVTECTLDAPVSDLFLTSIQERGMITTKKLGGSTLFTFTADFFSLKGMVGDTLVYISHRKEDTEPVQVLLTTLFE